MMDRKNLIYAVTSVALLIVVVICMMVPGNKSKESLQVLDEVIESTDTNNIDIVNDTVDEVVDNQPGDEVQTYALETASEVTEISPYDVIKNEIELIKAADPDMVAKYFGTGSVFEPSVVADKLAATIISFVSADETDNGTHNVVLHICTLDYNKMNQDMLDLKNTITDEKELNIEIAKGVVNGEYDLHYTIPVVVEGYSVVVTEEIKQALTGGWYTGVGTALTNVECPVN